MAANDHVTLYYKGQLIYGTEPAGYVDTAAARIATSSAVVPETAVSKIMIYPNPVLGDRFYIKLNNEWVDKTVHVKMYNLFGSLVMQRVMSGRSGVVEIRLDKPLATGVYMVQLNDGKAVKLLIEK
jgi:hypothetical protein